MSHRTRRQWAGLILAGLLGALFVITALAKLFGAEPIRDSLEHLGLLDMMIVIGLGELISALLFLFPRTGSIGTVLLSSHMGGAICIHMGHGEPYFVQCIILGLVWLTQFLRHPGFFAPPLINPERVS